MKIFKKFLIVLFYYSVYACVLICLCTRVYSWPKNPEKGVRYAGPGVTVNCFKRWYGFFELCSYERETCTVNHGYMLHPQDIPSLKSPEYAIEGYQAFEKISFINKSKSLFIYE